MREQFGLSLVITSLAILTCLLLVSGTDSPARPWLALPFLLLCPGLAAVRLLHLGDLATTITLAVATSLGIETVLTTALIVSGAWSPELALALLVALTLGLLLLYHLAHARRTQIGSTP